MEHLFLMWMWMGVCLKQIGQLGLMRNLNGKFLHGFYGALDGVEIVQAETASSITAFKGLINKPS